MTVEPAAFDRARVDVFRLYAEGRFVEALDVASRARERFPEQDAKTTYWAACLLGVQGRLDEALAELRRGLERRLWWSTATLGDPDLDAARARPEFVAIAAECERRWRAAQELARLQLEIRVPPRGDTDPPLLIALHMRQGNGKDFVRHWVRGLRQGVVLAVPGSSQIVGIGEYGWDDFEWVKRDLAETRQRVAASVAYDPGSVILAGASQGAARAIQCALLGEPVPSRGFIAVVPAFGGRVTPGLADLIPLLASAGERGVRGWMVHGEADKPARDQAEELVGDMVRRGLDVRSIVVPGLGHDFPPDFDTLLPKMIDHVLSRS